MPSRRFLAIFFVLLLAGGSTCHAQALNNKVAAFLQTRVGQHIGGGDCAHAVSEALRAAGGEFMAADLGADSPAAGDYVWGTYLKQLSYTNKVVDTQPNLKLVAGDVIQYHNAKIVTATGTITASHHTSVVAAVNSSGMPTFVYEQNFNNIRKLTKDAIDLTKLSGGYVRIYRPKARIDKARQFKFTIVNNSTGAQTVTFKINPGNASIGTLKLDKGNTVGSYLRGTVTASSSSSTFQIAINNSVVSLVNAGGYEVYTANGRTTVRRLTP